MKEHAWRALGRQIRRPTGLLGRALGHLMAWEHRSLTAWALEHIQLEPNHHVLDIGCGSGAAVAAAAGVTVTGHVTGIDFSPPMVRQARRRVRRAVPSGRAAIVQGRVEALPFRDGTLDRVFSVETFFFWDEPITALREVHRVLRTGGRCAIVMESSRESPAADRAAAVSSLLNARFYSGSETVALLKEAGFRDAWYETVPDRARGWLCAIGVR